MTLHIDLDRIRTVEFGVGRKRKTERDFTLLPVARDVQDALHQMVAKTWENMGNSENGPSRYEPSEKHGAVEYLHLPLRHPLAVPLRRLHQADNLAVDTRGLADPDAVFCYFVRITDATGQQLTAVRRAAQFKGILKSRLIRITDDALRIVQDKVFKLDIDFDVLVDSHTIHILRPSAFEFLCQLQGAVLDAVPANVAALARDLPFVDFKVIESYASTHPRAARYLASVLEQEGTNEIDKRALKEHCESNSVVVHDSRGRLSMDEEHVMGFLEVLDRRRFAVRLVKDVSEQYRAPSRHRLHTSGRRD